MRKSELEDMVDNLKNQVIEAKRGITKLRQELNAMAECLNLVYVPPKTSKLKYKKKGEIK